MTLKSLHWPKLKLEVGTQGSPKRLVLRYFKIQYVRAMTILENVQPTMGGEKDISLQKRKEMNVTAMT